MEFLTCRSVSFSSTTSTDLITVIYADSDASLLGKSIDEETVSPFCSFLPFCSLLVKKLYVCTTSAVSEELCDVGQTDQFLLGDGVVQNETSIWTGTVSLPSGSPLVYDVGTDMIGLD